MQAAAVATSTVIILAGRDFLVFMRLWPQDLLTGHPWILWGLSAVHTVMSYLSHFDLRRRYGSITSPWVLDKDEEVPGSIPGPLLADSNHIPPGAKKCGSLKLPNLNSDPGELQKHHSSS